MYKALKFEEQEKNVWSVQLLRTQDHQIYWVDVFLDEEYRDVEADWSQYIFYTGTPEDAHRERVQSNCDEFDEAASIAICFLEYHQIITQDHHGNWKHF